MTFAFTGSAIVECLRFLFVLRDFFVKIWLLYAFILFSLPVPVAWNLFAAEGLQSCHLIMKHS